MIMIKDQIHQLPVVDDRKPLIIITITELFVFLSSSILGVALFTLQAIWRGTK